MPIGWKYTPGTVGSCETGSEASEPPSAVAVSLAPDPRAGEFSTPAAGTSRVATVAIARTSETARAAIATWRRGGREIGMATLYARSWQEAPPDCRTSRATRGAPARSHNSRHPLDTDPCRI